MKTIFVHWKAVSLMIWVWCVQVPGTQAQAVHEVLCNLQERKLGVAQQQAVFTDLYANSVGAILLGLEDEHGKIESHDLIDWGDPPSHFPTREQITSLGFEELLDILTSLPVLEGGQACLEPVINFC